MANWQSVRLFAAALACVAAGLVGFGGLDAFYLVCGCGGLLAGRLAIAAALPAFALCPALIADIGIGFHADRTFDYVLAAPVILGGGALAALLGAWLGAGICHFGVAIPLSRSGRSPL